MISESDVAGAATGLGVPALDLLFHASPVGISFVVDRELREVNDRLCEITGYSRAELIGASTRILYPSDTAFDAVGSHVYPLLAEHGIARTDAQLKRKDGQIIDVALSLALVSPQEPDRGAIATILDITDYLSSQSELRAARARLEVALEAGDLGFYEGDMSTGEAEVDARFLSQLGLPPDEKITVERWLGLIHPDDQERVRRIVGDTIDGRVSHFDTEYRIWHTAGDWRWMLDRWQVYTRGPGGEVRRVVGVHMDITDRKQTEACLAELNRTLERRIAERTAEVERQTQQLRALSAQLTLTEQRERKRLATIMHEHIQQLIVGAQLQIDRIGRNSDDARVQAIADNAKQALSDALASARTVTAELSPPILYDAGLSAGLNWLSTQMHQQHGLAVHVQADPAADPNTDASRALLFECTRELLTNVARHAGASEAEVVLDRPAPTELRLLVADQGTGFDPALLSNQPPHQMNFGLFGIKERVAHFGGHMEIDSPETGGTRITLRLPLAQGQTETLSAPDVETPIEVYHAAPGERSHRQRVLVVDAHRIVREGLAGLLALESDIVVVGDAADGDQAIGLVTALQPDVVVMGINLGAERDGIEATRRLLAASPGVKVIALSMHLEQTIADAVLDAGAVACLSKDGPPRELIDAIRADSSQRHHQQGWDHRPLAD